MNINQFLDRPIAFHRAFVALGVGVAGALMLSQSMYWSKRTGNNKGWFYKTQADWEDETGMTRSEQEKARRALKSIGVLYEVRKGIPAKLYFKVDLEKLESLLYGEVEAVSIDVVIDNYASTISKLSKTGYMRAVKAGVKAENVDYIEVLKSKGMICGICNEEIKLGPGRTKNSLSFDHIKPICKGGEHVLNNIQPSHFSCNSAKAGNDVLTSDSSMLKQSRQACFDAADSCEPIKQTNTETTQRLPETTTETTEKNKRAASPSVGLSKSDIDQNKVFEHWQTVHGKQQAKLIKNRLSKINARFKEGYTVDQLNLAIDGCKLSSFHMGQNDKGTPYNDLTTILRDGAQVEKFIELALNGPVTKQSQPDIMEQSANSDWHKGDLGL